jgi:hypothetical protein
VVARGELGNDASVVGVHLDLTVQGLSEQAGYGVAFGFDEGDAGFVAGGLDAQDAHRGSLGGALRGAAPLSGSDRGARP